MKTNKVGHIPDSGGAKIFYPTPVEPVSTMRVMAVISLLVGALIALIGLFRNCDLTQLAFLCGVFVGPAFAGKAMQKHIELRGRENEKK